MMLGDAMNVGQYVDNMLDSRDKVSRMHNMLRVLYKYMYILMKL